MKLPAGSNFFYPNPVSEDLDRTLQSPEYGEEFSFLLKASSAILVDYLKSPLSGKEWRPIYRTGCRRPLRELADNLDRFRAWLVEFVVACPDGAKRLLPEELLQLLRVRRKLGHSTKKRTL